MTNPVESLIRLRMSTADGHYGGGLVDGARIIALFGDAVTELLIRHDGDYIEVRAKILSVGKSSRQFECTAYKVIEAVSPDDSAATVLAEPILVVKATGTAVVPLDKQRK